MLLRLKNLISYLTIFSFAVLTAGQECQTPTRRKGNCIPINECPLLYEMVQKRPISQMNADFLRKSQCGFVGVFPKVCCPAAPTSTTVNPPVIEGPTEAAAVGPISSNLLPTSSCGLNTQNRIYGGEKTDLDEFPWMALLHYRRASGSKGFLCGGALISKRYVLTAAHCVSPQRMKQSRLTLLGVRLGEHDVTSNPDCISTSFGRDCAPEPVDFTIEEQIVHESYSPTINNYNDIALLRLNKDAKFTDFVMPICLPLLTQEMKKTYVGQKLFVAGWGDTENRNIVGSAVKLKVQLPVKSIYECNSTYFGITSGNVSLTTNQMCAGGEAGKDSCKGDSGGPLMTVGSDENRDRRWFIAGIVSYGPTLCGNANLPGIYTKVSKYVGWIVDKMRD